MSPPSATSFRPAVKGMGGEVHHQERQQRVGASAPGLDDTPGADVVALAETKRRTAAPRPARRAMRSVAGSLARDRIGVDRDMQPVGVGMPIVKSDEFVRAVELGGEQERAPRRDRDGNADWSDVDGHGGGDRDVERRASSVTAVVTSNRRS